MVKKISLVLFLSIAFAGLWDISCLPLLSAQKIHRVAMVTWRGETPAEKGFSDGLKYYGHAIHIIKYHANQDMQLLDDAIAALGKSDVDLIYVFGTTSAKRVLSKIKQTPVVFNIVTRPVESKIIASWNSSGNNATGVSSMVPIVHQLKALKKVVPFFRLGIIYNPLEQNSVIQKGIVKGMETMLNFRLTEFKITGKRDIPQVLTRLNEAVDAVYLPSDSMIKILGTEIITRVNKFKIPSLSALEDLVTNDCALMGLVPDYYQLGRLAALKASLIFQGNHPSEIKTSTLDHFKITVNMHTAKKIGINIPTSILVMADKIIR
ncbi:ABC transporter substrate-binding protein [Desulfobacula toluolica]|uniref:ABC transporter, substrate-binding protein n=1 Tax=Desulfobacula toluolica (strain DSM 7467 / Tol2) TaxID=651182 RepID=K0NIS3_DESTT|nr:ABC transporter substrate-binding protein [Desulfobacula toluolica]CCK79713.1 ABC transporter, substrate-binding protein [Desulfobacula toluolica Tol2]